MVIRTIIEKIHKLKLTTLLKIVPFVFAFHEFEEWNTLSWHLRHQSNIPTVADIDLRTIFLFLTGIVFIIFSIALLFRNKKVTAHILFPFVAVMFYNGLEHFYWTLYFSDYSPGLIFGFFIGVPLLTIIMYKKIYEKLVNKWYLLVISLIFTGKVFELIYLGDKLDPGIVNLMLLGQRLANWLWF